MVCFGLSLAAAATLAARSAISLRVNLRCGTHDGGMRIPTERERESNEEYLRNPQRFYNTSLIC